MTDDALPQSATILLVEDETAIRLICYEVLAGAGFALLTAQDGPEALRLGTDPLLQPIDLLLTDVFLPGGLNGIQLAQQLADRHAGLKVLYMSGTPSTYLVGQRLLIPTSPFLAKPFTVSALLAKVNEVLSGPAFS